MRGKSQGSRQTAVAAVLAVLVVAALAADVVLYNQRNDANASAAALATPTAEATASAASPTGGSSAATTVATVGTSSFTIPAVEPSWATVAVPTADIVGGTKLRYASNVAAYVAAQRAVDGPVTPGITVSDYTGVASLDRLKTAFKDNSFTGCPETTAPFSQSGFTGDEHDQGPCPAGQTTAFNPHYKNIFAQRSDGVVVELVALANPGDTSIDNDISRLLTGFKRK